MASPAQNLPVAGERGEVWETPADREAEASLAPKAGSDADVVDIATWRRMPAFLSRTSRQDERLWSGRTRRGESDPPVRNRVSSGKRPLQEIQAQKVSIKSVDSPENQKGSEARRLRWKTVEEESRFSFFPEDFTREVGTAEFRGMEFFHVRARSIIHKLPKTTGLPFSYTLNVYRGCSHACVYCFARPSHEYLQLNMGEDFEKRIVVKVNAVALLRAGLSHPSWSGQKIALGSNTDPYQRCEGKYRLVRGVIEVLLAFRNPFSLLTKSTLILRDLDVLREAAALGLVRCDFSIGTLDTEVWRLSEPGTPHPARRLEAVRRLNEAGVPCGVLVAPVLPGLSDDPSQIDEVVAAAVAAGADQMQCHPLNLRPGVRAHYFKWLARARPDLLPRYQRLYTRSLLPASSRQGVAEAFARALARHGPVLAATSFSHRDDSGVEISSPSAAVSPPISCQLQLPGL